MFENILEKVTEATTRMSKTLSMFEKEYTDLRVKFTEELMTLQDVFDSKIKGEKEDIEKFFSEYEGKFNVLIESYKAQISEQTTSKLDLYGQEIKNRFENLYVQYEEEAKNRALQTFNVDIVVLFERYGNKIVPLIFKALIRYIFRSKKK